MKKFLITLFIGVAFIGLGAGYCAVELTSLETRSYNPLEITENVGSYNRTYRSNELLDGEEISINAGTYMTRLKLIEDETVPLGQVTFEAEYPRDIIEINSYERSYGDLTIYAHAKDSFVYSAVQNVLKGLREKAIYYPRLDDYSVTIKVKVNPQTSRLIDIDQF